MCPKCITKASSYRFCKIFVQFRSVFDPFLAPRTPQNHLRSMQLVSNESLECSSMILTKKVFSGMINKASGALNTQLVFVCLQKPRLFVNKKQHPPNFLKICSSNVDFSSQKEKSHQNETEHHQNEQKRKRKQRAQRRLVAKF